ncbi:MAG: hypothetical protein IJV71_02890 [Lachnospiraceae bacterium]|nr:hypothetical protein [Lachnospiraceae bacterium]
MKAVILFGLVGLTIIIVAVVVSAITYFIIRAAFRRNTYEYEHMFNQLKARIAGDSFGAPGWPETTKQLLVDLDDVWDSIDKISKVYASGRIIIDDKKEE